MKYPKVTDRILRARDASVPNLDDMPEDEVSILTDIDISVVHVILIYIHEYCNEYDVPTEELDGIVVGPSDYINIGLYVNGHVTGYREKLYLEDVRVFCGCHPEPQVLYSGYIEQIDECRRRFTGEDYN